MGSRPPNSRQLCGDPTSPPNLLASVISQVPVLMSIRILQIRTQPRLTRLTITSLFRVAKIKERRQDKIRKPYAGDAFSHRED